MTGQTLDLQQRTRSRAWSIVNSWASRGPGVLVLAVCGAAGGLGVAVWTKLRHWTWPGAVAMGIAAAAAGVVLVFLVALLINLPRALRQQRNEARQRLLDIKEAAESYSIEVVRTDTAHRLNIGGIHPTMMVHTVEIRNTGRSAQFAVVLDEIEGIFGGSKAFRYLHWADRPGVVSEEIPPGEGRVIESIVTGALRSPNTRKGDKGPFHMFWTVMMSDGTVSDDWTPMGSREDLVVWIRISTRNLPNINYSRRVGLALRPNGIGRLLPERPGDVVITRAPRLDALLDF